MRPILISTAALALAGLGCGGGDDKASSSSSATATPQAVAPPPAELLGTYTTTMKRSDIPDPAPPELDGQYRWTLRITKDGGPDDKPALTIVKPPDDVLESSAMAVTGDELKLTGEECAAVDGRLGCVELVRVEGRGRQPAADRRQARMRRQGRRDDPQRRALEAVWLNLEA